MFTPKEISRIKTVTWENHSLHESFIQRLIDKVIDYGPPGGAISKTGTVVPDPIGLHLLDSLGELKRKPSPTRIEELIDLLSDAPQCFS